MASINPYLNFNGNCEAAFNLYKSVFGGEFQMFSRFGDMPSSEEPMPASEVNKILHVALPIGSSGNVLMGSDCPPEFPNGIQGNLFNISVNTDSKEEADRIFSGLSEGGNATMPIADTFWGAYFGMCADQFGVQWMVNYDYPKS
ncbi:MAG: VOC family protein [Saprospiraceae bacterium]|nr:VOC family protein [Saprospiraceae bacterium]